MSLTKHGKVYPIGLAALAINYSEQIYDACEPESEEIFNRLLIDALEEKGYKGLSIDIINKSIAYYLAEQDVDFGEFDEYFEELPASWS